jgi:hypothetical protein
MICPEKLLVDQLVKFSAVYVLLLSQESSTDKFDCYKESKRRVYSYKIS